ncbi:MAG: large conductance mechanosensitive channel protein MscL [Firmicutes bacterium]|nr:large conductance mechanosensitive channel protein MscL [Bacillota bacterium]
MKKFMEEFKEFALKGNVMDMAVGVIIGAAFGNIVTALTENIINPLIGCIGNPEVTGFTVPLIKGQVMDFGAFITAVINFLIMALILFCLLKSINKMMELGKKKEEEEEAATTKECPFCKSSDLHLDAVKCPHCASELK